MMISLYIWFMRPLLLTCLLCLALTPFCHAQSPGPEEDSLRMLLPVGKRLAHLFGPGMPELTQQEKDLKAKVSGARQKNAAYLNDPATKYRAEALVRMGITEEEMEGFEKIMKKSVWVSGQWQ